MPDSVGKVFNFGRPTPLVSVSQDGKSLPEPYVYRDILDSSLANTTYTPSKIIQINGEDAKQYLENLSQRGSLQDRDALYNNVFYELAVVSQGSGGAGMVSLTLLPIYTLHPSNLSREHSLEEDEADGSTQARQPS